jgi:hypothetical protein
LGMQLGSVYRYSMDNESEYKTQQCGNLVRTDVWRDG